MASNLQPSPFEVKETIESNIIEATNILHKMCAKITSDRLPPLSGRASVNKGVSLKKKKKKDGKQPKRKPGYRAKSLEAQIQKVG